MDEQTPRPARSKPGPTLESRGSCARRVSLCRREPLMARRWSIFSAWRARPRTVHGAHHPRPLGAGALVRWQRGGRVVQAAAFQSSSSPSTQSALCRQVSALLAQAPLFAALSQEDREHLGETARIRAYQPGELIVREGDTATGCFIIASGKVEVVKGEASAHPTVLTTLGAGEFFGEMAVIDDHPRSASSLGPRSDRVRGDWTGGVSGDHTASSADRRPDASGSGPPPAPRR